MHCQRVLVLLRTTANIQQLVAENGKMHWWYWYDWVDSTTSPSYIDPNHFLSSPSLEQCQWSAGCVQNAGISVHIKQELKLIYSVHKYCCYRTRVRSLVTHSLTHSCLVNLIDVTLACEDANSKLVWGCYCWWCWCWGSCWQQFVTDLEADVWS